MSVIIVATDEEEILARNRFKGHKIIKTGVGGLNVIHSLRHIPRWVKIINFGYAGSNNIPKGTEVEISFCSLHHPNCEFTSPSFTLNKKGNVRCYTSNDFVLESDIVNPCVFDMELAYICALGFKRIKSIKIISDNLNIEEYENEIRSE